MMKIAWLQPWWHRRPARGTHPLAAAVSRWPFVRRTRCPEARGLPDPSAPISNEETTPPQRVSLPLRQHLDVNLATAFLRHQLDCDGWHVTGRHDHQLVLQLTQGGRARYCVAYDCSPAVEKAVCHGSRAWTMAITPLHREDNLSAQRVMELKAGLGELHA